MNGPAPDEKAKRAEAVMWLMQCFSFIPLLLSAKYGTVGRRYLFSRAAAWGHLFLVLFAFVGQSVPLQVFCGLAAVHYLVHAAHARKFTGHSYYLGDSRCAFVKSGTGHRLWCMAFFAPGFVVHAMGDPALGWWMLLSGGSGLLVLSFVAAREKAIRMDVEDARIESERRAWQARPQDEAVGGEWR